MSRLSRRHDKLLRQLLAVTRERTEAQLDRASRAQIERLSVRERALVAAVRRIRLELGLPEAFDPDHEAARLSSASKTARPKAKRRLRRDAGALEFPDRSHVKPVPVSPPDPDPDHSDLDTLIELVSHAARFCARRAADELLDRRASPAPGEAGRRVVAWPSTPLARTENGDIDAGSAGPLMGDLVSRAFDNDESMAAARVAVRSYVDEFTTCVVAALRRERAAAEELGSAIDDEPAHGYRRLHRELARAACESIAAEVRAARRARRVTPQDIATIGELEP